jgi:hypothetical protein
MDLAVWRDISLMWLIFLTFIAVLPFGALFYFAIRGMRHLRQLAKQYLPIAQQKAAQVADLTAQASQKVANPFMAVHIKAAQVDGIVSAILSRRKRT